MMASAAAEAAATNGEAAPVCSCRTHTYTSFGEEEEKTCWPVFPQSCCCDSVFGGGGGGPSC